MPQNYFLTGMPKAGKTTVLWELVDDLKKNGLKVGGFLSPDEKHHGTRTAFHVVDVSSRKKAVLAEVDGDGPKVSKYHVNIKSFEGVAIPAMRRCSKCDVMVIDEIGRMEMKSRRFLKELDNILDSDTPLIASLGSDYVERFEPLGEVVKVTSANREAIHRRLLKEASGTIKKKAAKSAPSKKKVREKAKRAKPKKKAKAPKKMKTRKRPSKKPPKPKERKPKKPMERKGEPEEKKGGFLSSVRDLLGL